MSDHSHAFQQTLVEPAAVPPRAVGLGEGPRPAGIAEPAWPARQQGLACVLLAALALWALGPAPALAQQGPGVANEGHGDQAADADLEQLMALEVQSVFGASKFLQKIGDAPAAVTVVTAEDIRRFGYRNLADLLARVRGLYVTDDRIYAFAGVRGFQRPGDYNTRVLVLIDGFRANDNVYDQGPIGDEFAVPLDMVERVEIVRGSSSSLYGSNAFFAVVNVITKRAAQLSGTEGTVEIGSLGERGANVRFGRVFGHGAEIVAGAGMRDRDGHGELYFPEFDGPETGNAIARELDWQRRRSVFVTASIGGLYVQGAFNQRDKGVPTGAYGSVFNDPGASIVDEYGLINIAYDTKVAGLDVRSRGSFAHMGYDSLLSYEGEQGEVVANRDTAVGRYWGAETMVMGTWRRAHRLTAGLEFRRNVAQDQRNEDVEPREVFLDDRRSSTTWAWYAQDEIRVAKRHLLNVGLRQDYYENFEAPVMPRVAWIISPADQSRLKLMYGSAFRAPNAYETWYAYGTYKSNPSLQPERVHTLEGVFEQEFARRYRVSAGVFRYWASNLIGQVVDPDDDMLVYRNGGDVEATGVELEFEGRWANGIGARASLAAQDVNDIETGDAPDNAPARIGQVAVTFPVMRNRLLGGIDMQAVSARRTKTGEHVDGYVTPNLTLLAPSLLGHVDVSFSVYNLTDTRYFDPASDEHVQDAIRRDGRTVRLAFTWRF